MKLIYTRELFSIIQHNIETNTPIYHVRMNDGEIHSMFSTKGPKDRNGGGHYFTHAVGEAMLTMFIELCKAVDSPTPPPLIMGTYCFSRPMPVPWRGPFSRFRTLMTAMGVIDKIKFATSGFWYSTELEQLKHHAGAELIKLIDTLRQRGNIVLVGNSTIEPAKYALGASFVEIPFNTAFDGNANVMSNCLSKAKDNTVFIWCAAMAGKVWSWNTWKHNPTISCIDAGHLFDVAFGNYSRKWTVSKEGRVHLNWYRSEFIPYLAKFVPKSV